MSYQAGSVGLVVFGAVGGCVLFAVASARMAPWEDGLLAIVHEAAGTDARQAERPR